MTLAEFYARVARALGRGSSLDTVIPDYVEEAVQQIESNYDFQYMKRWLELSIDADAANPHIISLYQTPVKKIELFRYVNDQATSDSADDRFVDLKRIEPKDRATRQAGLPTGYWLDGVTSIVLDSIPDQDLTCELHAFVYSVWSGETGSTHYLIDRRRTLLLSETVLVAAVDLRDPRLVTTYSGINQRAWTQVNTGEEDLQQGGADNQMEWSPPYDEFDPNFERTNR